MEHVNRLERRFTNFLAESAEDVKLISQEIKRLRTENARLEAVNKSLLHEKVELSEKLKQRICQKCLHVESSLDKNKHEFKSLSQNSSVTDSQRPILANITLSEEQDGPPGIYYRSNNGERLQDRELSENSTNNESFLDIKPDETDSILLEVASKLESEIAKEQENVETPGVIKETPVKRENWRKLCIAERIIRELLGPSQPPNCKKDVLATSSPNHFSSNFSQHIVPETAPQPLNVACQFLSHPSCRIPCYSTRSDDTCIPYHRTNYGLNNSLQRIYNETTPKKSTRSSEIRSPIFSACSSKSKPTESSPELIEDELKPSSTLSSPICVVSLEKLTRPSFLVSPSRGLQNLKEEGPVTPKRKRISPRKGFSPRKRIVPLKKSHRIEIESSQSGVKRLTQTQLNVTCFKKPPSHPEDNDLTNKHSVAFTPSSIKEEDTPAKSQDEHTICEDPLSKRSSSEEFLNDTILSLNAVKRIADDVMKKIMHGDKVGVTYDNVPENENENILRTKDVRKKLPGQECPECEKFFAYLGDGDIDVKQRMLNQCSKHRTRKNIESYTPPGFWKPMLSQTLSPGGADESFQY